MIRNTRHESVLVNARRSRGPWVRSRSSSVTGVRGEPLERCDMVVLQVVEEWGEADVSRSRVRDDAGGREVAQRGRRIRGREHDDRGTLLRAGGHLGPKPALAGARDQILGERRGDRADAGDPDLIDAVQAAELRVDGCERWRAQLETARVLVQLERAWVESELVPVPEPPRDPGVKAHRELRTHVQEHDPGPTEQPLESPRREEVDPRGPDVHGHLPHRLIGVDQGQRAALARGVGDGRDVLDRPAREVHVRRRHQRGALVHRAGDGLHRHRDLVGALDHNELDSSWALGEPLVSDRREVERRDDDFRPARVVEGLGHARQGDRDAGSEGDLRGSGPHDPPVPGAELGERRPPHVVPRGRAARLPQIEELADSPAGALAQGAEGAGVEVHPVAEDRKLAPVAREPVSPRVRLGLRAAGERHRRSIYRRRSALDTSGRRFSRMQASRSWPALAARLALRAIVNPRRATDLVRLAGSFRARGWYHRPPFLPLPPRDYVRWRMFTAYGDEDAVPPLEDVVRFARWRRETMHL